MKAEYDEILDTAKYILKQIEKLDYSSQCAVIEIVQELINAVFRENLYQEAYSYTLDIDKIVDKTIELLNYSSSEKIISSDKTE